jgi:hypothetical protein
VLISCGQVLMIRNTPTMRQMFDYWISLYPEASWKKASGPFGVWRCDSDASWGDENYEQGAFISKILSNRSFRHLFQRVSYEKFQVRAGVHGRVMDTLRKHRHGACFHDRNPK